MYKYIFVTLLSIALSIKAYSEYGPVKKEVIFKEIEIVKIDSTLVKALAQEVKNLKAERKEITGKIYTKTDIITEIKLDTIYVPTEPVSDEDTETLRKFDYESDTIQFKGYYKIVDPYGLWINRVKLTIPLNITLTKDNKRFYTYVESIPREYVPRLYKEAVSEEIDVQAWVRAHRPGVRREEGGGGSWHIAPREGEE